MLTLGRRGALPTLRVYPISPFPLAGGRACPEPAEWVRMGVMTGLSEKLLIPILTKPAAGATNYVQLFTKSQ